VDIDCSYFCNYGRHTYQVVWDMNLNDESKTKIKQIEKELKKVIYLFIYLRKSHRVYKTGAAS